MGQGTFGLLGTLLGGVLVMAGDVVRSKIAEKNRVAVEKQAWDCALLRASLMLRRNLQAAIELDGWLDSASKVFGDAKSLSEKARVMGDFIGHLGFADPVDATADGLGAIPAEYWDGLSRLYGCSESIGALRTYVDGWLLHYPGDIPMLVFDLIRSASERLVQEHVVALLALRNNAGFKPLQAVLTDHQVADMLRILDEEHHFPVVAWLKGDWSATKLHLASEG